MWTKFNPEKWTEEGWIFCDTCGAKNRNDKGWYSRERQFDPEYERLKSMVMLLAPTKPPLQKREYKCPDCRRKDVVPYFRCGNE